MGDQTTYDGTFVDQEADLPLAYDPSGKPTWDFQFTDVGKFLKGLGLDVTGGNPLKSLGSLFTGKSDYGPVGQMAAFGGLAALLNKLMGSQSQPPVGYQGGIPKFTYERTQTPMEVQRPTTTGPDGKVIPYRPGQGGISYFAPASYQYAGYTPKTAQEFLVPPATTGGGSGGASGGASGGSGGAGLSNSDTSTIITNAAGGGFPVNQGPSSSPIDVTTLAASGGYMPGGGIAMLAGGRYLRGPGDGVSDSIPAKFERSGRPARLADGEFVIDARTVSEIGNGSSEAGARKLYAMMDRVQRARKTAQRGKPSNADKYLPK